MFFVSNLDKLVIAKLLFPYEHVARRLAVPEI